MDTVLLCGYLVMILLTTCHGRPGEKEEKEVKDGPCIGMDCLHGILMHNDEVMGQDHKAEDQYLRFQDVLETQKPRAGPNDAETEHHGVLMHADDVRGKSHQQHGQALPEEKKPQKPKDPNESMHDFMHGEEGVHKHAWDEEKPKGAQSPPNEEQLMHGLMMHGNLDYAEHHDTNETKRDGDGEEAEGMPSPPDQKQLMHGLLMHGDLKHGEHHDTEKSKVESTGPVGPLDAEEQLHGVLMHNDKEPGHHHDHETKESEEKTSGPKGPDPKSLHGILMHGDTEQGHDHTEDHEKAVHEVFKDITKILEMELGEDLLRIIDLKSLLEKDRAEYSEYLATNPQTQNDAMSGSSYASVSDSILSDIELMKQKYLTKLADDIKISEAEAELVNKRINEAPFTADDAKDVLGPDIEANEDEDKHQHNMELIGRTDPINARHKMHQVLEENKKQESKEKK